MSANGEFWDSDLYVLLLRPMMMMHLPSSVPGQHAPIEDVMAAAVN